MAVKYVYGQCIYIYHPVCQVKKVITQYRTIITGRHTRLRHKGARVIVLGEVEKYQMGGFFPG